MRWDYVSELRPPTDLLFVSHLICEYGEPQWNDINRENRRTRRKTCPSATLSTTNPIWTDPGANPILRGFVFQFVLYLDDCLVKLLPVVWQKFTDVSEVSIRASETLVNFYQTTRCNTPGQSSSYSPSREPKMSLLLCLIKVYELILGRWRAVSEVLRGEGARCTRRLRNTALKGVRVDRFSKIIPKYSYMNLEDYHLCPLHCYIPEIN
jgi:hypothetical protein